MRVGGWFLVFAVAVSLSACKPAEDMLGEANSGYLEDFEKYITAADWSKAVVVPVELSEFKFRPKNLTFRAGQAYALELTNLGGAGHNFAAGDFFRAIAVKSILYSDGEGYQPRIEVIALDYQESKTLFFVAVKPGEYPLICDKPLHAKLGQTGSITIVPN